MLRKLVLLVLVMAPLAPAHAQPDPATVYAWYQGDEGLQLGADGYGVLRWTNHGAQAVAGISQAARDLNRVVGAPQKLYLRRANNAPAGAVVFDGNDGLWAARSDFGTIATNRTLIFYARVQAATNLGFLFDASSFTGGLTRGQVRTGYWHVGVSGTTNTSYGPALGIPTAPVVTGLWQTHVFMVLTNASGARLQHFIDGVLAADAPAATNGALGGLILGVNVATQYGIQAEVAEVLVFDRALDAAARGSVETYLSNKWHGVTADPNPPPAPVITKVFEGGKDGYACYRIPAMVTTLRGTIIAVADGRISGCGDIPNPLDLVARRSYDNGRTWTPLQVIANYGSDPADTDVYPHYGITNPIPRVSAGDAALLLDRTNGRVWVLYDNGGTSGGRKIKLEMRYSDDEGTNWSSALDLEALNPGLRPSSSGEFLAGPGNGIQLTTGPHAGRLIFPVYLYGSPSSSMVIYSDDHGQTWQRGGVAGLGGGEIQVAETAGGGLLASMRDNNFATSGVRTFSRSSDGGLTWGEPYTSTPNQPALPDPACQGSILRLTTTHDSNASRLVFANAADASSRIKMTLRLSYDEGATWPVSHLVYAGSSAYSSLTRLATDEVGLLYEVDNYTRIDFVRRSVEEISGGSDALPAYTVWAGRHFTPAQLMNPDISGPGADPDQDGLDNHAEFIAGTDPLNPASKLQLNFRPRGGALPRLSFEGQSNRSYTVQHRDAAPQGEWRRYADIAALASNTAVELDIAPTNAAGFFRVATPQLP